MDTVTEYETAVWCAMHNSYADETCGDSNVAHVRYEVEYDAHTGKVLTSPDEQHRRHLAAAAGMYAWEMLAARLRNFEVKHEVITAEDLMEMPEMVEILRRAREGAHDEAYMQGASAVWRGETTNPHKFQPVRPSRAEGYVPNEED